MLGGKLGPLMPWGVLSTVHTLSFIHAFAKVLLDLMLYPSGEVLFGLSCFTPGNGRSHGLVLRSLRITQTPSGFYATSPCND